jgi:RES domain-containing protein
VTSPDALPDTPPVSSIARADTHRLIPSKYSQDSVLARLAGGDDALLADLFDLDGATNERLLADGGRLPGIGPHELIFGVPHASIVNAAFTHAHPSGSRFNGPDRGAWYAAYDRATSVAEVAFHRAIDYAEIGVWDDQVTYDDYLSDVAADLHDVRTGAWADCLDPASYVAAQGLAERLLESGALGVVYPSVRDAGGTCVALFRPALVTHVRKGATLRFTWNGSPVPVVEVVGG